MITASVQAVQIERSIVRQTTNLPIAEFRHQHVRMCMAFTVGGKPFIQVHGGQFTMEQAGALQVAIQLAQEWLMEMQEAEGDR